MRRDVCRAEFLVSLAQGITREEGAHALKLRAAIEGQSVHAAALAVLSAEPTDELSLAGSSPPVQAPTHRHLYAVGSLAAEPSTVTADDVASPAPGGRHRRR